MLRDVFNVIYIALAVCNAVVVPYSVHLDNRLEVWKYTLGQSFACIAWVKHELLSSLHRQLYWSYVEMTLLTFNR